MSEKERMAASGVEASCSFCGSDYWKQRAKADNRCFWTPLTKGRPRHSPKPAVRHGLDGSMAALHHQLHLSLQTDLSPCLSPAFQNCPSFPPFTPHKPLFFNRPYLPHRHRVRLSRTTANGALKGSGTDLEPRTEREQDLQQQLRNSLPGCYSK